MVRYRHRFTLVFADVIADPAGFTAACIGTAVALYPVTRRVGPALEPRAPHHGRVAARVLRADLAGATGAQVAALAVTGQALVPARQWTFLLGPGLIPGINALFLGYVLYRARLGQLSTTGALCALPIAFWELTLGVWLTVKGFRPTDQNQVGVTDGPVTDTNRLPAHGADDDTLWRWRWTSTR